MKRRLLCWAGRLLAVLTLVAIGPAARSDETTGEKTIEVTGKPVPELKALDDIVTAAMRKGAVPGGALAVVKDGRLVFAHGYGVADRETGKAVQPDSLFRIASLSKPITSAAILKLVEQGKLDLDAKALDILKPPLVDSDKLADKRWKDITIRQLLFHTAGFDRNKSFDPMFRPRTIAKATGTETPPDARTIIRYMLGQPLDFEPGTKFAYSNFGYCVLGRVIEQVTGKSYEEAVKELVLQPAGITRMRIGRTRWSEQSPDEVRYYADSEAAGPSWVFPEPAKRVFWPYGGFYLEAMDSHGGWVASAIDLARFANALDGTLKPGLLRPETMRQIESRPPPPFPAKTASYYGFGWLIHPVKNGAVWSHAGSLPGTSSLLVRAPAGRAWAVVFNTRPKNDTKFIDELETTMWKAVSRAPKWPEGEPLAK